MSETPKPNPDQIKKKEIEPSKEFSFLNGEEFLALLDEAGLETHKDAYQTVLNIAEEVKARGGRALLVGGSVRDFLMGKISKDFDMEIYGLEAEMIRDIVAEHGKVEEVGMAFGVLKVMFTDGIDIDVSLPRKDSKTGEGHKGFNVETDPNMSIEEAARRRDFTFNSICADPMTGELYDPFGGAKDIRDGVLKVTDQELFKDDPLRVLRAMQFIGRFEFTIDSGSEAVLKEMVPLLKELPKERLLEEWRKLLLKSHRPSNGLEAARELGVIEGLHPELHALVGTEQEYEWHPEGDVWVHTLMVVDQAAQLARDNDLDPDAAFVQLLTAVTHDTGKPSTTKFLDGRIRSRGHEEAGEEPTKAFLASLGVDKLTTKKVVKLTTHHLKPTILYLSEQKSKKPLKDGTIRRLAKSLHPATIRELVMAARADHFGRDSVGEPITEFPGGDWLLERARRLEIQDRRPSSLTKGRDWIKLGYKPGIQLGRLINLANELRDEKEYAKQMVLDAVEGIDDTEKAADHLEALLTD